MSSQHASKKTGALTLAALGVVYGDIGTSPLYAFREAFSDGHGLAPTSANILATLSALFWAITLIVACKYVWLLLRFDNKGEGGVLALQTLARRHIGHTRPKWLKPVAAIGVLAAALFYADAMITPAISVLSAVEGISIATPQFEHWVIPITLGLLIGLFLIQRSGTSQVGKLFGPVSLTWFLSLGILGVSSIVQTPEVLQALNPLYALRFAWEYPVAGFVLLSAVFLALTGGEALYADMGHFGKKPIRIAWYGLVWPSLILNYFGQGALVIRNPSSVENPFYLLISDDLLIPLVVLATLATIVASQATITGAYSLTQQAIQLGYLPHMNIRHTSDSERGQIYLSNVNWLMLAGVMLLVLGFGSASALASAYGVAVSGTMVATSLLVLVVAVFRPNQRLRKTIIGFILLCLCLELLFFASNLSKIVQGGWLPVLLGIIIFTLLTTWKVGTQWIVEQRRRTQLTVRRFIHNPHTNFYRTPGAAVYLASSPHYVPRCLSHNMKYFRVIHQKLVFLHVSTLGVPYVPEGERLNVTLLAPGIYSVIVQYGFRDQPDLNAALSGTSQYQLELPSDSTSFFVVGTNVGGCRGVLSGWRCGLFRWMMRQSVSAASYYKLPSAQVMEISVQE